MGIQDLFREKSNFVGILDGCDDKKSGKKGNTFDSANVAADYALKDIKLKSAATIQQWAEDDVPLAEGETQADRLYAMLVGIADANKDGEITEEEATVYDMAANCAWDYLTSKGVDDDDAGALLNDWDVDAADRIRDLMQNTLPDGDGADDEINEFAFGEGDEGAVFDSVFKKVISFVNGVKTKIKKRISGTVRLSGAQKAAIKKMHMKSHSAGAMMKRAKSMLKRKKAGL